MNNNVLVLTGGYYPACKYGGPSVSLYSLVEKTRSRVCFKIITADRDLGDNEPYQDMALEQWIKVGHAEVFYANTNKLMCFKMVRLLKETKHDILYLNSFFSPTFTIMPLLFRKLGLIPKKPVLVAPRGEFSLGALKQKEFKKRLFVWFAKLFNIYEDVTWHAISSPEKQDILRHFGNNIIVAPNLPSEAIKNISLKTKDKIPGKVKFVFLSRISPKKNLLGALSFIKELRGDIVFDIYGPIEDGQYYQKCAKVIDQLPSSIECNYGGIIEHDKVIQVLSSYHIFVLPTFGENYGHVIAEALRSGCPVIISDQTPWRELEKEGIGWDIALENRQRFIEILQKCVDMDSNNYNNMAANAYKKGQVISDDHKTIEPVVKDYIKLFDEMAKTRSF